MKGGLQVCRFVDIYVILCVKAHLTVARTGIKDQKISGVRHFCHRLLYAIECEVIDQDVPCIEMNLVQRIDTVDEQAGAIYEKYSDVFNRLGCMHK